MAGIVQLICWSGRVLLSFLLDCLNCFAGFVLLCFFISFNRFVSSCPDFLELTFSMTSVTSTALELKFGFVTSFLLLDQLRYLPHSKKNDF